MLTTPAWWLAACAADLARDEKQLGRRAVAMIFFLSGQSFEELRGLE